MFILYMAELVAKHQVNFHSFADDSGYSIRGLMMGMTTLPKVTRSY